MRARQRAPADCLDARNLCAPMPVLGGVGGAGAQLPPGSARRQIVTAHPMARAVPPGHAHRRRGPHACGRPHGHWQVGAAGHPGVCSSGATRAARPWPFNTGRRCGDRRLGLAASTTTRATYGWIAFQPLARIDRAWATAPGPRNGRRRHRAQARRRDRPERRRCVVGPGEPRQRPGWSRAQPHRRAGAVAVKRLAPGTQPTRWAARMDDADVDRSVFALCSVFEMEELMPSRAATLAVLSYLFAALPGSVFDGAPATPPILDGGPGRSWIPGASAARASASGSRTWRKKTRRWSSPRSRSPISRFQHCAGHRGELREPHLPAQPGRPSSRRSARSTRASGSTAGRSRSWPRQRPATYHYQSPAGQPGVRPGPGPWCWPSRASSPEDQRGLGPDPGSPRHSGTPSGFAAGWRHRAWICCRLIPRSHPFPTSPEGVLPMLLKSLFLRRKAALALAAALALGTATPAQAFLGGGRIVFDPQRFAERVTAARTLEQINNQIKQSAEPGRNLASLDHSALGSCVRCWLRRMMHRQARGLAFHVVQMESEFRRRSEGVRRHRRLASRWRLMRVTLAAVARKRCDRDPAHPGGAQLRERRADAHGSGEPQPVGRGRAAGDAGHGNQLLALQSRQRCRRSSCRSPRTWAAALQQARRGRGAGGARCACASRARARPTPRPPGF